MKEKGIRLWQQLALIFISILLITLSIFYLLMTVEQKQQIQKNEEQLLLSIGRQLAMEPRIISALKANKSNADLQQYANQVAKIHGLDFIVVMNQDAIRLTHPNSQEIGKAFMGGDEAEALAGHEHLSMSEGTLGQSIRSFVPVIVDQDQVGVVALGITVTSLQELFVRSQQNYEFALLFVGILGAFLALLIANYLKRQLHNLEPREISRLLEERNAMLEETKDAVFVTDLQRNILMTNKAASMFLADNPLSFSSQRKLEDILPTINQMNFDLECEQFYQQNGQDYLFSAAPIVVRKQRIGYIVFLRNATEALFVADQLANTAAYTTTLQSQSHEFMNKLHVIYGLANLKAYQELAIYLEEILKRENELTDRLTILIKNPILAGFLIGERQKFTEKSHQLWIEVFPEIPKGLLETEITTLLNLYRYIHHILLEIIEPLNIWMKIDFTENRLTTCYQVSDISTQQIDFYMLLGGGYFQQLLKQVDGIFEINTAKSDLVITLVINYHQEV